MRGSAIPCCGQDGYRAQVPQQPIDTYIELRNRDASLTEWHIFVQKITRKKSMATAIKDVQRH